MNMNTYKQVLIPNIRLEMVAVSITLIKPIFAVLKDKKKSKPKLSNENKLRYPPKNNIDVNIHINTILAYSARKKNTNITAECSVIKPETNSDSASAK